MQTSNPLLYIKILHHERPSTPSNTYRITLCQALSSRALQSLQLLHEVSRALPLFRGSGSGSGPLLQLSPFRLELLYTLHQRHLLLKRRVQLLAEGLDRCLQLGAGMLQLLQLSATQRQEISGFPVMDPQQSLNA
jgi:hypothetical protein